MASSAKRVSEHRASLRAQGLRPVQLWVRDTRSDAYALQIRQQIAALRDDPHEQEILDDLERLGDRDGWT